MVSQKASSMEVEKDFERRAAEWLAHIFGSEGAENRVSEEMTQ